MRGADADSPAPPTAGIAVEAQKGAARMTAREELQQQAYDRAVSNEMNYYG
jgi:hypothetical protein